MKFLRWFFGLFTPYVNRFERKVDKFFKNIKSTDNINSVKRELLILMKENLIVLNIWMERKYKGYKYLKKSVRKQMYADIDKILNKFEEDIDLTFIREEEIGKILKSLKIKYPYKGDKKIQYLYAIILFLKPGKYYKYIKTASFGKLLRNPNERKLEGDCNQIVTLYIYLYSRKFPIEDLEIKLLPEHVCLHFKGIDIECTTGEFQNYLEYDHILPVTEIISTNLLDLSDFREEVQTIGPREILKSAQFAFAISSLREIVSKNLNVAYNNLALSALKSHDFSTAIFYFEKLGDPERLKTAIQNASIYFLNNDNYKKARFYAAKAGDEELLKKIKYNEGVKYYKEKNAAKALKIFRELGDEEMKKASYGLMYNELVKVVKDDRSIDDIKRHKSTYRKLLEIANKMEDQSIIDQLKKTLKQV